MRKSAHEEDVTKLQAMPVDSMTGRGDLVWSATLAIQNVEATNIAELLATMIDADVWRGYEFPNGVQYEWRENEFDYFIATRRLDPRLVRSAVKASGDKSLQVALVEASLTEVGDKRRSREEIIKVYPEIEKWLKRYGLRSLGSQRLYGSPELREQAKVGGRTRNKAGVLRWSVDGVREDLAEKIATKLVKDQGLCDQVLASIKIKLLHLEAETRGLPAKCNICGSEITGKRTGTKTCSQVCRNKANKRRAAA